MTADGTVGPLAHGSTRRIRRRRVHTRVQTDRVWRLETRAGRPTGGRFHTIPPAATIGAGLPSVPLDHGIAIVTMAPTVAILRGLARWLDGTLDRGAHPYALKRRRVAETHCAPSLAHFSRACAWGRLSVGAAGVDGDVLSERLSGWRDTHVGGPGTSLRFPRYSRLDDRGGLSVALDAVHSAAGARRRSGV